MSRPALKGVKGSSRKDRGTINKASVNGGVGDIAPTRLPFAVYPILRFKDLNTPKYERIMVTNGILIHRRIPQMA